MLTVLEHGILYQLVAKSQLALLIHTLQVRFHLNSKHETRKTHQLLLTGRITGMTFLNETI